MFDLAELLLKRWNDLLCIMTVLLEEEREIICLLCFSPTGLSLVPCGLFLYASGLNMYDCQLVPRMF